MDIFGIITVDIDIETKENKEIQKRVFNTQIEIAKALNLPIVVHDREAHNDVLEILKAHKVQKVLLHCYSGSVEFMKECKKLGYKIALGGVVTFKNAKEPKNVAMEVNIDNLMLETDCPYLAPHPFRGVENSPKYIGFVAKEIANLRNITYDDFPNMEFVVNNISGDVSIELPRVYYLGYELIDDGGNKITLYNNDNGFLSANINGNGVYKLSYVRTKLHNLALIIRLITILMVCLVLVVKFKKWRKKELQS